MAGQNINNCAPGYMQIKEVIFKMNHQTDTNTSKAGGNASKVNTFEAIKPLLMSGLSIGKPLIFWP